MNSFTPARIRCAGNQCHSGERNWVATHNVNDFATNDIERFAGQYDYCVVTEKNDVIEVYVNHGITNYGYLVNHGFHLKPVQGRVCDALNKVLYHGKKLVEKGDRPKLYRNQELKNLRCVDKRPLHIKENREWTPNDYFVYGVFPPAHLERIVN